MGLNQRIIAKILSRLYLGVRSLFDKSPELINYFQSTSLLTIKNFYKDRVFLSLVLIPIPFWLFLYIYKGFQQVDDLKLFFTLILLYPILEEILFRGLIQPTIAKQFSKNWLIISQANLITSAMFVFLHFISHPPLWALAVFIPSITFGYIQERVNHILAPITLHTTYNAGYFLMLG